MKYFISFLGPAEAQRCLSFRPAFREKDPRFMADLFSSIGADAAGKPQIDASGVIQDHRILPEYLKQNRSLGNPDRFSMFGIRNPGDHDLDASGMRTVTLQLME